jgi:hypothetical protein
MPQVPSQKSYFPLSVSWTSFWQKGILAALIPACNWHVYFLFFTAGSLASCVQILFVLQRTVINLKRGGRQVPLGHDGYRDMERGVASGLALGRVRDANPREMFRIQWVDW